MKSGKIAACAAALSTMLLALAAQGAAAAPGLATTNVNLRQGPGTTYTVITTIPGGSNVDVSGCSGAWCQVTFQGQNGYVIATSLDQGGGAPPPGGPPPPPPPPPPGYPPGYVVPPPPYYYGYGPYYGYGHYYGGYGGWRGGYYGRRW